VPQFSLSIIRGSNILIMDDALPGHVNPQEYLQLLQNMLFALGDGRSQLVIDRFVWPISKRTQVDQSETAARQTLESFLAKQVDLLNTRYVLAMGATAVRYISAEKLDRGVFSKHPTLDAQLIHTSSAIAMLTNPSAKRDVWRDLQPLHRVLKKH
jgi:uracil-DNA glycosylase